MKNQKWKTSKILFCPKCGTNIQELKKFIVMKQQWINTDIKKCPNDCHFKY